MIEKIKGEWKRRFKAAMDFKSSPHQLALSFGFGVVLGVMPGTGAVVAAVAASILRLNLLLMVAGALLTNPITAPFLYIGSYFLGKWLLGDQLHLWPVVLKIPAEVIVGNLILALGFGLLAYLIVFGVSFIVKNPRR